MSNWKPEYIINGNKFSNSNSFYNHIEKVFTNGLNWKIGRNLNAFNDVLSGGFGEFDCEEQIILNWKNIEKSKEVLNESFFNSVVEIIKEHNHITFITSK